MKKSDYKCPQQVTNPAPQLNAGFLGKLVHVL